MFHSPFINIIHAEKNAPKAWQMPSSTTPLYVFRLLIFIKFTGDRWGSNLFISKYHRSFTRLPYQWNYQNLLMCHQIRTWWSHFVYSRKKNNEKFYTYVLPIHGWYGKGATALTSITAKQAWNIVKNLCTNTNSYNFSIELDHTWVRNCHSLHSSTHMQSIWYFTLTLKGEQPDTIKL